MTECVKRYLIFEANDEEMYEDPICICSTRADAEECYLALAEEEVYGQALWSGIDVFFKYAQSFREKNYPKLNYKTSYGTALWFMAGRYRIKEIKEYA